MPTEHSWPRLRAILDKAVESPYGIEVVYADWQTAERVRQNMYKIRDMMRRDSRRIYTDPLDPNHGISAYDGLTFWIRSTISRLDQKVEFIDGKSPPPILTEMYGKKFENENLFPGRKVKLTIGDATCEGTTYQEAWEVLRRDYPATLIIENGYNLDNLDIKEIK